MRSPPPEEADGGCRLPRHPAGGEGAAPATRCYKAQEAALAERAHRAHAEAAQAVTRESLCCLSTTIGFLVFGQFMLWRTVLHNLADAELGPDQDLSWPC